MIGWGWVRSYDGKRTRTKVLEANIKIQIQGKFRREKFRVLEETGDDILVLGDPWLANENPAIDWKKRIVQFRSDVREKEGEGAPNLRIIDSRIIENMEPPWKEYSKEVIEAERKKSKANNPHEVKELETRTKSTTVESHSDAYIKELGEIQQKLRKEIKDFADVFSTEE